MLVRHACGSLQGGARAWPAAAAHRRLSPACCQSPLRGGSHRWRGKTATGTHERKFSPGPVCTRRHRFSQTAPPPPPCSLRLVLSFRKLIPSADDALMGSIWSRPGMAAPRMTTCRPGSQLRRRRAGPALPCSIQPASSSEGFLVQRIAGDGRCAPSCPPSPPSRTVWQPQG